MADLSPEERAVRIVRTFNDEPPGSPRRSPPLAVLVAGAIRSAEEAARGAEREACASLCERAVTESPSTAEWLAKMIRARWKEAHR